MKAVNLIPPDQRRVGGSGSGIAAYAVLAILALIVSLGAAYALINRSLADRRAELASVQTRARALQAETQALADYTNFAALRQKRTESVRELAAGRFDWSHAMYEVSRTIPAYAWLTSMRATVTPSSSVEGGTSDPLRGALPLPAIELNGCTTSQDRVAAVISNLRRVDGVQRVSLSSSAKGDDNAAPGSTTASTSSSSSSASSSANGGDCRHGNARFPQFSMTLFFNAPTSGAPATTTGTTR